MKNSTKILIGVVVVALVGVGLYFGNTKLQKGSFVKLTKTTQDIKIVNTPPGPPENFKVDFYDKGAKFPWKTFPESNQYAGKTGITAEFKWYSPKSTGLGTGELDKYRLVVKRQCKYPTDDKSCVSANDGKTYATEIYELNGTFTSLLLYPYTNYEFQLFALGKDKTWSEVVVLNKFTKSEKLPTFPDETGDGYTLSGYGFTNADNPNWDTSDKYTAEVLWPDAISKNGSIKEYRIATKCLKKANGSPCDKNVPCEGLSIMDPKYGLIGAGICNNDSYSTATVNNPPKTGGGSNYFKLINLKKGWTYSVAVYPSNNYGEGPPRLNPQWKF